MKEGLDIEKEVELLKLLPAPIRQRIIRQIRIAYEVYRGEGGGGIEAGRP